MKVPKCYCLWNQLLPSQLQEKLLVKGSLAYSKYHYAKELLD